MREVAFTLKQSRPLTADTWELILSGDSSDLTRPGQFVNIELPGKFLRRPISVCDWGENTLTLLVRIAGAGSRALTEAVPGTVFSVLSGLGNGFDPSDRGTQPILIGGGVGTAPLYGLARRLIADGVQPTVALGFRTAADAIYTEEFSALGCRVLVATEDGSLGFQGFVTAAVTEAAPGCDYAFVCGPTPMLRAVHRLPQLRGGQFSFEERMGCGFGACMGCTIPTASGYKRICKDGPILTKEEIVW